MLWKKHQKTWKHPPQTITLHRGGGGHPLPNLIWEGHQQFLHYEATSVSKPLSVIWTWGNGCLCSVVHLELTVPLYCFGMLCSSQEKRMSLKSMFKTITQRKLSKFHHVPILPAGWHSLLSGEINLSYWLHLLTEEQTETLEKVSHVQQPTLNSSFSSQVHPLASWKQASGPDFSNRYVSQTAQNRCSL